MRKNILILLTVLVSLCGGEVFAQNSEKKQQEREIKISGNYYYGDGIAPNEIEALKAAQDELKLMVSEHLKEENRDVETIDFDGFEQNIGTLTMPIEGRFRAIAFVHKKEIKIKQTGEKRLMVIRVHPNSVTDEVEPQKPIENKINTTVQTHPKSEVTETNDNPIITELLKTTESKQVGVILNKYKSTGKLLYGRLNSLGDPDNCYFVILKVKEGKLVDVLDKSSGNIRKGLITGDSVDYTKVSDTIYWIYIN